MMSTTWVRHRDNSSELLFALNLLDMFSLVILTTLELLGFMLIYGWRFSLKGWQLLDVAILTLSWITFWTSMRPLRIVRILHINGPSTSTRFADADCQPDEAKCSQHNGNATLISH
ncbi:hypothetical protein RI054_37g140300 [Pseudoscourfieldia marina]